MYGFNHFIDVFISYRGFFSYTLKGPCLYIDPLFPKLFF